MTSRNVRELSTPGRQAGYEMIEYSGSLNARIEWARGGVLRLPMNNVLHNRGS